MNLHLIERLKTGHILTSSFCLQPVRDLHYEHLAQQCKSRTRMLIISILVLLRTFSPVFRSSLLAVFNSRTV